MARCTTRTFWKTTRKSSIPIPSANIAQKCSRKVKRKSMQGLASWSQSIASTVTSTCLPKTSTCTLSNVNLEPHSATSAKRPSSTRSSPFTPLPARVSHSHPPKMPKMPKRTRISTNLRIASHNFGSTTLARTRNNHPPKASARSSPP